MTRAVMPRAWAAMAALALAALLSGCAQAHPLEPDVAATTSTPVAAAPSPSATATAGFADGSSFDADCAVAWPTAPVVSKTSIQLTLTCPSVPSSQYVFVVAVYDDPTLAVTTATTKVHVTGTVSDTALTNTGLSYLIVKAATIEL